MTEPLPIVLVPGLVASARLYGEQLPVLWRLGPVTIADHTRDDTMAAIASRILAAAPPASRWSACRHHIKPGYVCSPFSEARRGQTEEPESAGHSTTP
jgi:hypothetical protein